MAVIDLRGGNQNPWAQFLPAMFQKMTMMNIENKYAMEQFKQKAIYDAQVKKEDRKYQERKDIETFNRELEGYRSKLVLDKFYKAPEMAMIYDPKNNQYVWGPKKSGAIAKPGEVQKTPEQIKKEAQARAEGTAAGTPPSTKETPEQKRAADLKIKKDFYEWQMNFKKNFPEPPSKGLNANQQRVLDQSLADAGATILNNPESEAVKPHIEFVNKYLSKEPYIYTWVTKKGFWGEKGKAQRVDLPVKNGKQITAADIKYTIEQERKTMNDVLTELGLME